MLPKVYKHQTIDSELRVHFAEGYSLRLAIPDLESSSSYLDLSKDMLLVCRYGKGKGGNLLGGVFFDYNDGHKYFWSSGELTQKALAGYWKGARSDIGKREDIGLHIRLALESEDASLELLKKGRMPEKTRKDYFSLQSKPAT